METDAGTQRDNGGIVMSQQAAEEAYQVISKFLNGNMMYKKQFADALVHDHKLLQGYFVGLMVDCIAAMAKTPEHCVSPQNRPAVELCKTIVEAIGDYPQYL